MISIKNIHEARLMNDVLSYILENGYSSGNIKHEFNIDKSYIESLYNRIIEYNEYVRIPAIPDTKS